MKYKLPIMFAVLLFTLLSASPLYAANHDRTSVKWITEGKGGVDVIPYIRSDKKAMFVDFENFGTNIDHVYYNLTYNQKWNNISGGVEGHFYPHLTKYTGSYKGKNYIRKEILFGTCSKNSCVLHHPKNVMLTVTTHMKSGKIKSYTRMFKFPDNQF